MRKIIVSLLPITATPLYTLQIKELETFQLSIGSALKKSIAVSSPLEAASGTGKYQHKNTRIGNICQSGKLQTADCIPMVKARTNA